MKKMMIAVLVLAVMMTGCSRSSDSNAASKTAEKKTYNFTMSGGASGGSMHMLLAMLGSKFEAKFPGSVITVMAGGLNSNPRLVGSGELEFAITSTDIFPNALAGRGVYEEPLPLAGVSRVNTDGVFYFMVRKNTGLESIDDMIAKKYPLKMVTFIKGQSPEITTEQLFAEYGITYDDIISWGGKVEYMQWADAVSYCRDGNADAMVGVTTLPSSFHSEFATFADVKLLPVKKSVIDSICSKHYYEPIVIPANSYNKVDYDVETFGFQYLLFSNPSVPDDLVYELTKIMHENIEEVRAVHSSIGAFSAEIMPSINGPIHAGAEKFYKETGLLK